MCIRDRLKIIETPISELDLSNQQNLFLLTLDGLDLTELSLQNNLLLQLLSLTDLRISNLDISRQANLNSLFITRVGILEIDLSSNFLLSYLSIRDIEFTEIDLSQNIILNRISLVRTNIPTVNLESLPELEILILGGTSFEEIDLSHNAKLSSLSLHSTSPIELDLSQNPNLIQLDFFETTINHLDLSNNPMLSYLDFVAESGISSGLLDVSNNPSLVGLGVIDSNIETIIARNGREDDFITIQDPLQQINYICVEPNAIPALRSKLIASNSDHIHLSSFCFLDPGGETFEVSGKIHYGPDCDLALQRSIGLLVTNELDFFNFYLFTDALTGEYNYRLPAGTYQLSPDLANLELFRLEPDIIHIEIPGTTNQFVQDFCVVPRDEVIDLSIHLWSFDGARPGFEVDYTLRLRNNGTANRAARAELFYDNETITFVESELAPTTIEPGKLTWDIDDLPLFQEINIPFTMRLNSPMDTPPLNTGDELCYTAQILPLNDFMPTDNQSIFKQEVVNAFDPNDKTCLEGSTIPVSYTHLTLPTILRV